MKAPRASAPAPRTARPSASDANEGRKRPSSGAIARRKTGVSRRPMRHLLPLAGEGGPEGRMRAGAPPRYSGRAARTGFSKPDQKKVEKTHAISRKAPSVAAGGH